ncbi:MAG: TonB-dependent receptor [Terracidiphilus sp.]
MRFSRPFASVYDVLALILFCAGSTAFAQQQAAPNENNGQLIGDPQLAAITPVGALSVAGALGSSNSSSSLADPATISEIPVIPPVQATIEVNAGEQAISTGLAAPYHITQEEVLSAAGTWGDFTRYLQLLPGVVWNSDMSNDVMVRGGNPAENLFVVDGIEVPNINHLALEGTTGGFTSMMDTSTIESVDMKPGSYDARYSSRLSSLIEIHTRQSAKQKRAGELDVGISGAGGFIQLPFAKSGSLLLSAHRSVLNLATDDIGLNGVPIYTNGMAQLDWSPDSKDHLSVLSLSGADSMNITPHPCDEGVTLDIQTEYNGSRSTNGLVWQHTHSPAALSTVTVSYSAQNQTIAQQLQSTDFYGQLDCESVPIETTPAYSEQTGDGIGTLQYGFQFGHKVSHQEWLFSAGVTARLVAMNYAVSQPVGQQSPFNVNPNWTDANSFARRLASGQTAAYAEVTGRLGERWTIIAGAREETFALTGAHVFEPRASAAFRISAHQTVNATYSQSSQLPPSINILSDPENARLRPIEARQFSLGAELWRAPRVTVALETYHKSYSNEPVSTEYPSLMLANMVDTLGQEFIWLPLKTGGHGQSDGAELLVRAHANRLRFMGSVSESRTRYAAADGVLRPGNFDFPLVSNVMITGRMGKGFEISIRDTYASGRPYTPFNIELSEQQSRGIYDLTEINSVRGSAYNRIDADFNRNFQIRKGVLNIHAGMENILDRANFLGYAWMDNCHPDPGATVCGQNIMAFPGVPETKVTQMPAFPSAGIRYSF